MSANATLEFISFIEIGEIERNVSKIWTGRAYSADIVQYPELPNRLFCVLDYFFGYPQEKSMFYAVLSYLYKVSSDKKIFYYRCYDLAPSTAYEDNLVKVEEVESQDIFSKIPPSLGASLVVKYLITADSLSHLSKQSTSLHKQKSLSILPGADIILPGIKDLEQGNNTTEGALLLSVAATRLSNAGLIFPKDSLATDPELTLYGMLEKERSDAYPYYNALLDSLCSFCLALEALNRQNQR